MFTVFTERESKVRPSGKDSTPAADGDPGRSTAEKIPPQEAKLVSDCTKNFEKPQTGISLVCDLTDQEIRENIRKTGFLRTTDFLDYLMAAIVVLYTVVTFRQIIAYDTPKNWIILVCLSLITVSFLAMPYSNLNHEKKKYQESGMGKVTIYPDRIELPETGSQLPLDGTAELLRTEKAFTLVYPFEKEALTRTLRCVIIPFRCVQDEFLPYVEAMLTAGTRPKK
ncbi:hypothetical protein [Thermocaproicibacter melissae]|jgi:hypothetical protein|uniref:hypothetical protein n=1 Tax=Thermocaproicibacter melissae TaxID=2966552 RepID=UPI0024B1D535|nr:hypothetical protein [Thermocaproicibacter melissae]WBY64445.1 hypothetical protein NOG13_01645 [Thermocaproicibacter melissae]